MIGLSIDTRESHFNFGFANVRVPSKKIKVQKKKSLETGQGRAQLFSLQNVATGFLLNSFYSFMFIKIV